MAKPSDLDDWEARKDGIIGLGERSFRKSYYPQLRQNLDRLERFHTLLNHTSDFVILVSLPEGIVTDANVALGQLLGQAVDDLIGRPFASLGLGDAETILDVLRQEIDLFSDCVEMSSHSVITEFRHADSVTWLDFSYGVAVVEERSYGVMVGRDITERKRNHEMLTALLAEKEALLENTLVGIVMVRQRFIVSCNRRFEEIFGYSIGSMIGQSTRILYKTDEDFSSFGEDAFRSLASGQRFKATVMMVRADHSTFWCELTGNALDSQHPQDGSIWMLADVTERKIAEERAEFLSYHDALTGLPNSLLLQDRLQQAIAFSTRVGTKVALMVVDLDRFKAINDFLGHSAGNQMLVEVAARLRESVRDTDTVSRQGGDEFILLLTNLAEPDAVVTFLGELLAHFHEPFRFENKEIAVSLSVGVAIYPEDGADFETLQRKADMEVRPGFM